jgi:hypothetical protein
MLVGLIAGPLIIFYGIHANHRDRPSLQWPKVSGKMMQCDRGYHSGTHSSYYYVIATYTYVVNGTRYVQHQITLWSPDLSRGDATAFVAAHPTPSAVDVYYDPQNPANAVLIPGANEAGNRFFMIDGSVLFALGIFLTFMLPRKFARYQTQKQQEKTAPRAHKAPKPASLPHGFASYEPGNKRKLNVFPDKDALLQILGHDDGKPLQEWQPVDRIIDAAGREYRLRKNPEKNYYDLDATGETWSYERLLGMAQTDGRLLKKDPEAMRHRLDSMPESERMAVVMKLIDELPVGPRWVMAGFIFFLILFFVVITFVVGIVVIWVIDHWPQ